MTRVAVVFDQYGNPNQPFLTEWYSRIRRSNRLEVGGFSDRACGSVNGDVTVFKTNGISKFRRYLTWRIKSLVNPNLTDIPYVFERIVTFRPKIVHLLNAQQFSLYRHIWEKTDAKLVVSFRGYETSVRTTTDDAWKAELLSLYKIADKLHFVSDYLKDQAIKLGAPAEKCMVIRRSVDTRFFRPVKERNTSEFIELLAVGRLTWQKGYEHLLNVVAKLVAEDYKVRLRIVGTGKDNDSLVALTRSLKLKSIVQFVGHLGREDLRKAFQGADVFVQASVSDALPNSILEASACGLPVISTTAGGIPEAVVHGVTGILVRPGDVNEFTDALRRIVSDDSTRRLMGQNARKFVEDKFSCAYEIERWEKLYLDVGVAAS